MFDHILKLERDVDWVYGRARSAAYPLKSIDTIDEATGRMNKNSALALIVYGGTAEHLDLLDGLMEDILEQKWHAFAKSKIRSSFCRFLVYWIIMFAAFYMKSPGMKHDIIYGQGCPAAQPAGLNHTTTVSPTSTPTVTQTTAFSIFEYTSNATAISSASDDSIDNSTNEGLLALCYFTTYVNIEIWQGQLLLALDALTVAGALLYIGSTIRMIKMLGWTDYSRTLWQFPASTIFTLSPFLIVLSVPFRFACLDAVADYCWIFAVLFTSVYFLFFCRGIGFVGPFVLMIYKMIRGDMLRFFAIYSIFVMGFSQAFYVIFRHCESREIVMKHPIEAFHRMFIISVGEFTVFFKYLNTCEDVSISWLGKILFVIYELVVTVMLINMLIATMARTYQQVAETRKEYKRQRAQVILLLEQTLTPRDRLIAMLKYSRPIGTNRASRSFVVVTELSTRPQNVGTVFAIRYSYDTVKSCESKYSSMFDVMYRVLTMHQASSSSKAKVIDNKSGACVAAEGPSKAIDGAAVYWAVDQELCEVKVERHRQWQKLKEDRRAGKHRHADSRISQADYSTGTPEISETGLTLPNIVPQPATQKPPSSAKEDSI